jgi:hypothetical protein
VNSWVSLPSFLFNIKAFIAHQFHYFPLLFQSIIQRIAHFFSTKNSFLGKITNHKAMVLLDDFPILNVHIYFEDPSSLSSNNVKDILSNIKLIRKIVDIKMFQKNGFDKYLGVVVTIQQIDPGILYAKYNIG